MAPISGWEDRFNLPKLQKNNFHETGHAKNVASFLRLIVYCKDLGTVYNPANGTLKIESLEVAYQNALQKVNEVQHQKNIFSTNINNRRRAFEDLKPYATKIINAFAASGVNKQALEEAKSVNKKIQGVLLKKTDQSCEASQQSYEQKLEHLEALIAILIQNPLYSPNEEELRVTSLQSKLADLKSHNLSLFESAKAYSKALTERNQILYEPETGLISISKKVKQYIKSIFGANSEQYHQLVSIEFKVRKASN
ncbi:hypothetical protein [Flavobacterium suncheonense]|uniref:Uncharacterized protein n=1 Tax=Flavobacterium suncheonense GH29-5 = DSM 17707 TaxID=1121899 RepID=A0A0A2MDB8_9FLAO|nr:hypothetical protein [Flavobacterium suncheonense]KGO90269.1 hypothetical protein Q764_04230 [Flavobacterium suncheonense GH29-5 = DSM 17707]